MAQGTSQAIRAVLQGVFPVDGPAAISQVLQETSPEEAFQVPQGASPAAVSRVVPQGASLVEAASQVVADTGDIGNMRRSLYPGIKRASKSAKREVPCSLVCWA